MTRVLIILPESELERVDAERTVRLSQGHFAEAAETAIAAPAGTVNFYNALLAEADIKEFDAASASEAFDVFVFVEGYEGNVCAPGPHSLTLPRSDHQGAYWFLLCARMKLVQPATYDAVEYPLVESHIFQRLSGRKHEFVNFPYGPLYSDVEVGPVNEFGFRVPQDYRRLARRPANHKLIVASGGSAAFSFYCRPEEMFSEVLGGLLNDTLRSRGDARHVTALNFGMHDNVVMQEMLTYMMFVDELKPDVVLAHDGHSDIYYGLQDDPCLLNDFGIIYQRYSEEWSKLLHSSAKVSTPQMYSMAVDGQELNLPQNVIRTYIRRKQQFERMVRANGGQFVWGVQPIHYSKPNLSRREKLRYRQAERGQPHDAAKRKFLRGLYLACGKMSEDLARLSDIVLVDFNQRFQAYGDEFELLWDHCHASPDGDKVIAEHYHDVVLNLLDQKVSQGEDSGRYGSAAGSKRPLPDVKGLTVPFGGGYRQSLLTGSNSTCNI